MADVEPVFQNLQKQAILVWSSPSLKKALCNTTWIFLAAKLIPLFIYYFFIVTDTERDGPLLFAVAFHILGLLYQNLERKPKPSQIVVTLSLKEKTKHCSLQILKFLYIFPLECITESNKRDSSSRDIIIKTNKQETKHKQNKIPHKHK